MAVSDWSAVAANNIAIDGINIAEGCPPGNLNGMGRSIMAAVRVMYDGLPSVAGYMPVTGGTFSGTQPIYSGRGAFAHHNTASYTSFRVFAQASGGSTPSGMVSGDLLLEWA